MPNSIFPAISSKEKSRHMEWMHRKKNARYADFTQSLGTVDTERSSTAKQCKNQKSQLHTLHQPADMLSARRIEAVVDRSNGNFARNRVSLCFGRFPAKRWNSLLRRCSPSCVFLGVVMNLSFLVSDIASQVLHGTIASPPRMTICGFYSRDEILNVASFQCNWFYVARD